MRKVTLAIVVAIILMTGLVVAVSWRSPPGPPPTANEPDPTLQTEPETVDVPAETQGVAESPEGERGVAKRIPRVPGTPSHTRRSDLALTEFERNQLDALRQPHQLLDRALGGDEAALVLLAGINRSCLQTPSDRQQLDETIHKDLMVLESFGPRRGGTVTLGTVGGQIEISAFGSSDHLVAHHEAWFEVCQAHRQRFDDAFRSELLALSEAGNAFAKFLYSTWPQPLSGGTDEILDYMAWESNAYRFSMENLLDRPVLGLMAFHISYVNGYFTARGGQRSVLGSIYLQSALKCGMVAPYSARMIEYAANAAAASSFRVETQTWSAGRFQRAVDSLVTAYCP